MGEWEEGLELKILIVDDETPIREWMEFCLKKGKREAEVRLARNGEEALAICSEQAPDIVFTDIRMPVMDGLELTRRIRTANTELPIVILTSYNDFEYARAAIKLGAVEYVLKTEIDEERLWEIVDKLENKIRRGRESGNRLRIEQFRCSRFFQKLFAQPETEPVCEALLCKNGISLCDGALFAMALVCPEGDELNHEEEFFSADVREGRIENVTGFSYDRRTFVFVMNTQCFNSTLYQLNFLYTIAGRLCGEYGCAIGLSRVYSGLPFLRESILEAVNQIRLSFYDTANRVYQATGTPQDDGQSDLLERQCALAVQEMRSGGTQGALEEIDRFFEMAASVRPGEVELVKSCAARLVECAREWGNNREDALHIVEKLTRHIHEADKLEQVRGDVREALEVFGGQDSGEARALSAKIRQAVTYIDGHYAQNISLNEVADAVGLSVEYLSRLFKVEMGMTYTAYITGARLRQAERLLRESGCRVFEIAQKVGYPNISYFSTLFKKRFGLNPFDYRNANQR